MSELILTRAHNIYEQQAHNRRLTWLFIVAFILLIAAVGVGFDVFLNVSPIARIIILPFVILMVGSGIWNFRKRAAEGLWKKPQAFAEDYYDNSKIIFRYGLNLIATLFFLMIFLLIVFSDSHISIHLDVPLLRYLPVGTTLAVIIGTVSILTSLRWGMNSVLWSVHATDISEYIEQAPEVINVVKEMSLAAGMPCPSVHIVKDSDPNAFAIGSDPEQSSIVVTTGLIAMLDREELQGVIAHEMSHIRNADTRLMTIITILFGAVLLLSEWMKKSALVGGFAGSRVPGVGWILRGVLFIGWLLTILLAPLIARIIAMAVSRQREYLADAGGAELTRNPKSLARALHKIEQAVEPTISFQQGIAHLCIVDPLGWKVNSREGWWADLFATHPPIKNRILLLNAMAYETISKSS
jgi:heat shock protein HtpX